MNGTNDTANDSTNCPASRRDGEPVGGSADDPRVLVDTTNHDTMLESLGGLDPATQAMMLASLEELRTRDIHHAIVDNVRDVVTREFPGRTVVGVVFGTVALANVHYLSTYAETLFDTGHAGRHDFEDLDDVFIEHYGCVTAGFTVAVDLDTGSVDESETRSDERIAIRLLDVAPPPVI